MAHHTQHLASNTLTLTRLSIHTRSLSAAASVSVQTPPRSSQWSPWLALLDPYSASRVQRCATQARSYNTSHPKPRSEPLWPLLQPGCAIPSPYQILDLKKGDKYTKARFYELVKLYHPDSQAQLDDLDDDANPRQERLPDSVRLDRYRLIVAAHDLLSDPAKRSAYDTYGAGWSEPLSAPRSRPNYTSSHTDPFIWRNATWEDWERWRERNSSQDTKQPAPIYAPNTYFASLVILFGLMGSFANYSRAENEGVRFLAARDAVHDHAAKDLRRVRQEISGLTDKDERIDYFVRARHAASARSLGYGRESGNDVEIPREKVREERGRRLLPPPDTCMGGVAQDPSEHE